MIKAQGWPSLLRLSIFLLFVSCTTMVKMNVSEKVSNPNAPKYTTEVEVFKSPAQISGEYDIIGNVSVSDTGFSVGDRDNIHVYLDGNKQGYKAKTIVSDPVNDIATLQIKDDLWENRSVRYKFRPSSGVNIGEDVFTMGFPFGVMLGSKVSLTKGSISSKSGLMDDVRMFQTTTAIQPGNSGGPLIDMNGNVVGIVVATLSPSLMLHYTGSLPQNVNFAIKIDYLLSLAEVNDIQIIRSDDPLGESQKVSDVAKQISPYVARIVAE